MKIKLDENLPMALAEELSKLGHDPDTVPNEGLAGAIDPDVWGAAQREQTITHLFATENVADWAGCFVVATERKLRVHRP